MAVIGSSCEAASEMIAQGGIIAFPTETTYGLGASIFDDDAIRAIYRIKRRPFEKPFPVLISHRDELRLIVREAPQVVELLIKRFWPGPLTILFYGLDHICPLLKNTEGKVAVRLSSSNTVCRLIQMSGVPITGTSANLSEMPPALCVDDIVKNMPVDKIDYILDGGRLRQSLPSTIIDPFPQLSSQTPVKSGAHIEILREGVIKKEEIISCLKEGGYCGS